MWGRIAQVKLVGFFLLACNFSVSADTLNVPAVDRGWYDETGFHDFDNLNYVVGDNRGPGCGACLSDYRNFFVFDLSSIPKSIESATLAIFVLDPPGGYGSFDPSETYELHDVTTPIATLLDGTAGTAAHVDLGSGVVYGSRVTTATDSGIVIEIPLNLSAIAAMNFTHTLFGIGGSIITLDAEANDEFTFSGSGRWGVGTTELRLTLVPEPSTLLLLGIGAISLFGYRKTKSHG